MKLIDLIGKRFGRWTALSRGKYFNGFTYWICKCDCGTIKEIRGNSLKQSASLSCGCLQIEITSKANKKHGMAKTPLFAVWNTMKQRCTNPNNEKYQQYGARGITVCDEWKKDFTNFYDWAMTHGYEKGLSIDRVNVNGNYCPDNCRWATQFVQGNNKTDNRVFNYKGSLHTMSEISRISGINYDILKYRLNHAWDIDKATTLQPEVGRNQYVGN